MKSQFKFPFKKVLIAFVLLFHLAVGYSQNLFFMGDKSYPSTGKFSFNSDSYFTKVEFLIAKGSGKGYIAISRNISSSLRIEGKLIIYLDNGTVITCIDRKKYDHVNGIATTVYHLTNEELNKMQRSNVNSIRYSVKCTTCISSTVEGNYAEANKSSGNGYREQARVNVPSLIWALYN